MKKVSFRVRNFEKEQFLTYDIDNDAVLDEEVLDFLEDEEPKGIVPIIYEEGEERDALSYDITDKIRLCELSSQEINAEMVLKVMRGLVLSLIDMGEYRVPLSYLVMNRNYIYINSDYEVEFICIPLEDMQEDVDVNMFLRNFVASLRFESSENGDYVAKMLSYINNTAIFNLRNMLTLVEDLMDVMGVEIPEDSSADIYVDYQEVEDEEVEEEVAAAEEVVEDIPEEETLAEELVEETVAEDEIDSDEEVVGAEETAEVEEAVETEEAAEVEEAVEAEEAAEVEEAVEAEEAAEVEETVEAEEAAEVEEAVEAEEAAEVEEAVEAEETAEVEEAVEAEVAVDEEVVEEKTEEPEIVEPEVVAEELQQKPKKPSFKTKEAEAPKVVIEDDLDEYLAEREREDNVAKYEESGLKIRKNIKVNRASVVKSNHDETKDEEPPVEEVVETKETSAPVKKVTDVPKANPYLIRVNTEERIMITKQNFKVGKASMGVDYTVKGNSAVSRVHAIITCKDDIYYIKDNKSTNHTVVNGKTLEEGEQETLLNGCKIVLGDEEFVFKMG